MGGKLCRVIAVVVLSLVVLSSGCSRKGYSVTQKFFSGERYFESEDYTNAIKAFRSVVKAAPDHLGARFLLAQSYLALGKYDRAREQMEEFVDIYSASDPTKPQDVSMESISIPMQELLLAGNSQ